MTLKKRSFFKFITNLVGFFVGIITQSIVPRALGPAAYGDFSFLTSFFWQFVGFLNLNSSTVFYSKLSQRQEDRGLVGFYFNFLFLIAILLVIFLSLATVFGFNAFLWPQQKWNFIVMGALWAFLTFVVLILGDMSDALGLTVRSELAKITTRVTGLCAILFMFWKSLFNLTNYFYYQLIFLFFTVFLLFSVLKSKGIPTYRYLFLGRIEFTKYFKEFAAFCHPLLIFTIFSAAEQMTDRWFLQKFSGSVKQGFYALSYQISSICFILNSAVIPLVFREQSMHFASSNPAQLKHIFCRAILTLYSITAFFCCFFAIQSENVLQIFGGRAYAGAFIPLILMSFYPIHQTLGQLNANLFFSTERVKHYRNIGLIFTIVGVASTLFLLGPKKMGGLQAGASGLAVKMLILQILGTNVQLWINVKFLKVAYGKFLLHQISVILIFVVIAIICARVSGCFMASSNFIGNFVVAGIFYSLLVSMIFILKPEIFSFDRKYRNGFLNYGKKLLRIA